MAKKNGDHTLPFLSVIMPVFNEKDTIREIVERVQAVDISKEIIIVDDGSSDGTRDILNHMVKEYPTLILEFMEKNCGRGGALQRGLKLARGEIVINQDADLEYNPQEYEQIIEPFLRDNADVVYGSRFKGRIQAMNFQNYLANKFFNLLINILYFANISDLATCYKACRTHILRGIELKEEGFNMDIEMTIKILKKGYRIVEVPISFHGRSHEEGKKIGWKDGIMFIITMLKYRFMD